MDADRLSQRHFNDYRAILASDDLDAEAKLEIIAAAACDFAKAGIEVGEAAAEILQWAQAYGLHDAPAEVEAAIADGFARGLDEREQQGLKNGAANERQTNGQTAKQPQPGQHGKARAAPFDPREFWNPWRDPPVPTFPLDTLPRTLQARVAERVETIGCDPAAFAMGELVAISSMIDHRVVLKPKQWDDWRIHPNLWVLFSARVSVKKTPVLTEVARFAVKADAADAKAYQAAVEQAEKDQQDPQTIPLARQRIVRDATSEALVDLLTHQDCGCTLISQELSGWIGAMDKYSGGKGAAADKGVWLQAYDGGPFNQHRVKGRRSVRNLCVSILAAVQPEVLAKMGNLDSDGLLQRFIPLIMRDGKPGTDIEKSPGTYRDHALLLEGIGRFIPHDVLLTSEAREIFFKLDADMHVALKANDSFGSFCGKLPRNFLAITLLLHVCEVAEQRAGITEPVSLKTAQRAECIVRNFILPHASVFYGDDRPISDARLIAATILKLPGPQITLRQLMRATRALRGIDAMEVQKKLFPFVASEWITPVATFGNTKWTKTPGLAKHFAHELQAHDEAMKRIRDSIQAAATARTNK